MFGKYYVPEGGLVVTAMAPILSRHIANPAGLHIGSIQSYTRTTFGDMIPPGKVTLSAVARHIGSLYCCTSYIQENQYFALYEISDKVRLDFGMQVAVRKRPVSFAFHPDLFAVTPEVMMSAFVFAHGITMLTGLKLVGPDDCEHFVRTNWTDSHRFYISGGH